MPGKNNAFAAFLFTLKTYITLDTTQNRLYKVVSRFGRVSAIDLAESAGFNIKHGRC